MTRAKRKATAERPNRGKLRLVTVGGANVEHPPGNWFYILQFQKYVAWKHFSPVAYHRSCGGIIPQWISRRIFPYNVESFFKGKIYSFLDSVYNIYCDNSGLPSD